MAITDLIPIKNHQTKLPIRRKQGEDRLLDFRSQMNRLVDAFFERPFSIDPFFGEFSLSGDFVPRIDVSDTDKEITVRAELPGMEPENIDITLSGNALIIRGEKQAEKEEKGKRYYQIERSYGSFYRSIPLPDEVDENRINATFKNGVVKISLPKTAEAQKKSKRISVKTH